MFFDEKYILFLWKVYIFSIKGIIVLFERYNLSMKKVVSDPENVNYFRLVCNMQQLRQDGTFRQKKTSSNLVGHGKSLVWTDKSGVGIRSYATE